MTPSSQFYVGTLVQADVADDTHTTSQRDEGLSALFLSQRIWRQVTLVSCERVNHDTRLYRFALPTPGQPLNLPIGQHVFVRLRRKDTGELVQRAYTPVSGRDTRGTIEFLIKSVFARRLVCILLI